MLANTSNSSALSNDPRPLDRQRGGESHPAGENAPNNISRDQQTPINLDDHLRDMSVDERRRWQGTITGQPNSTTHPSHLQDTAPAFTDVGTPSHSSQVRGDAAACDFDYPTAYVQPSSDGPNVNQTSSDVTTNGISTSMGSVYLSGVPSASMEEFMVYSSYDFFADGQPDSPSHTPVRGIASVSELDFGQERAEAGTQLASALSNYLEVNGVNDQEDLPSHASHVDGSALASHSVRRPNTPLPNTSPLVGEVENDFGYYSEHDASSAAPGEDTRANNRRNRRAARRELLRQPTSEADRAFWREFSDSENDTEST